MKMRFGVLLTCGALCAGALAQSTSAPATVQDVTPESVALLPQVENGITYLCGGIGSTEAAHMKREAAHYNLMLTFAENTGAYLANVNVEIADASGKPVLQTACDAPILLVNFPKAGSYRVKADVDGYPVSKKVQVARSGRTHAVPMVWPSRLIETEPENLQGALSR
ncbi:MAG: hypothetical protein V4754_09600 [Pseudomonadota bacterium]